MNSGLFRRKTVVGMLHAPALPGSPASRLSLPEIEAFVCRDAETLAAEGVHALILENFGDAPFYPDRVPEHTIAQMSVLAAAVKKRWMLPLGINVLRNDGRAAIAVAAAAGAEFVRINVLTGARVTDQGVIQGKAHDVLRYRDSLKATVEIWADVAVKHSAPLGERPLEDEVEDTIARGRADAVIVSGAATGKATSIERLRTVKLAAGSVPVLAGSGVAVSNVAEVLSVADGVIVGTALKQNGVADNPVEGSRVRAFLRAIE